jgi:hypothetical membrane protein
VHTSIFKRGQTATAVAIALAAVSIARYPGGTYRDQTVDGYSPFQNFLSDLGMTVAYNGEPNRLGSASFVASLVLLVLGLGSCVVGFFRQYASDPKSRKLARAAAFVALLVCLAFLGVAATPENLVMGLHVQLTLFAFRAFLVSAVLFTLASRAYPKAPPRVWIAWSALTVALAVYVSIQAWGPRVRDPNGLEVQVIAQKAIAIIAILVLLYQSVQASKAPG